MAVPYSIFDLHNPINAKDAGKDLDLDFFIKDTKKYLQKEGRFNLFVRTNKSRRFFRIPPRTYYRYRTRGAFRRKIPVPPRKPRTYRIAKRPRRKKRKNYRRVCIWKKERKTLNIFIQLKGFLLLC